MTTMNDNKLRHYRSLEVLIQSQLAELTGPQPGIIVVLPHAQRLDAYTTVGAGLDLTDKDSLRQLRWVEARPSPGGWTCVDVKDERREEFLTQVEK